MNLMVPDEEENGEDGRGEADDGGEEGSDDGAESGGEDAGAPIGTGLLDPRAGSVHVMLPQIEMPIRRIVKLLKKQITLPQATIKGKRLMLMLCRQ